MSRVIIGTLAAVIAACALLIGTYGGNQANDKAHKDLGTQISKVEKDLGSQIGEVRAEMGKGFQDIHEILDERLPPTKPAN